MNAITRLGWLAAAGLWLAAGVAPAQTNFFTTNTTAGFAFLWSDGTAWTNEQGTGTAPLTGGSNNYAFFFNSANSTSTNDLGAPDGSGFRLNQLATTFLTTLSGSNLVFMASDGGAGPALGGSGSGAFVINNNLVLSNTLTYTTAGANADQLRGGISGSGGLVKQGPGSLTLFGIDSYTGDTVLSNGTLNITNGCWINTPGATYNVLAGTNVLWGGGAITVRTLLLSNNTVTATNALFTFNGGAVLTTSNANGLAADILINSNSSWTINGVWNMNAGTNLTASVQTVGGGGTNSFSGAVYIGNGAKYAAVNVNSGAVWSLGNNISGSISNLNLVIGNGSAGTNNTLLVNGGIVTNAGYLNLGSSSGAHFNGLVITNGGQVYNGINNINSGGGSIGSSGANGNFVSIGGTNGAGLKALWNLGNSRLFIGGSASGSTGDWLRVDQGGVVTNAQLMLFGLGGALIVTNGGQFFGVNGTTYIGRSGGSSNALSVGGTDGAGNPALGAFASVNLGGNATAGNISGTNNWVWVGAGGQLTATSIYIGGGTTDTNAAGNFMVITNGGSVNSTSAGYIGGAPGANSNAVYVAGALGATSAAWYLGANALTLGNNANGGNTLQVGQGGVVTNNAALTVGNFVGAIGNFMIITNGGLVRSGTGNIGAVAGANSNWVYVGGSPGVGTNATWNLGVSSLNIGAGGANTGNALQVGPGGVVTATNTLAVGGGAGSFGDTLLVNNGLVTNFSLIAVGSSSNASFNQMIITNGGQVLAVAVGASTVVGSGQIGYTPGAFSNGVLVTGTNAGGVRATWNLGGNRLLVGNAGTTGNWLRVDQGGLVTNAYYMSYGVGSAVLVTNGGQLYGYSGGNAFVGRSGAVGNSLSVAGTDGAGNPATFTALAQQVAIGSAGASAGAPGTNNWIWVGQGGSVTAGANLLVGGIAQFDSNSLGNFMVVTNGGQVKSTTGYIGADFGAGSNWVAVGGASGTTNAAWNLSASALNIGSFTNDVGNYLLVGQGGVVSNVTAFNLGTGVGAQGNFLVLTNGGQLGSGAAAIGTGAGAGSNFIYVGSSTAASSLWNLGGNALTLGAAGATGAVLTVAAGGVLTNAGTVVLAGAGAVFNLAGAATVRSVALNDATALLSLQDGGLLRAGASGLLVTGIGSNTLSGNVTLDTQGFTVTNTVALRDGGSSGSLTRLGSGTLLLAGANAYGGATTNLGGGTLMSGADNALPPTTTYYADDASTLLIASFKQQLAGLDGARGTISSAAGGALTVSAAGTNTFLGTLTGAGSLAVTGGGTLNLVGTNAFLGGTLISNATYQVNGLHSGGLITVLGNGVVGGTGAISALLVGAGGTYAPGNGLATQLVTSLTLTNAGLLAIELGNQANGQAVVTNTLTLAGAQLRLGLAAYTFLPGATITIIDRTTATGFTPTDPAQWFTLQDVGGPNDGLVWTNGATFAVVGGSASTNFFTINYSDLANGVANTQGITLTAVPEPGTAALLGLAGVACLLRCRRRR